jgi:hypothetical protein
LHFHELDEFQLAVPNPGLRHSVMLIQDRRGWEILHPNASQPETETDDVLVWPRQPPAGPPRFRQFDDVGGIHRILVIFTNERLPADVLGILLGQPLTESSLNAVTFRFNNLLAAGPGRCRMLTRRFLVFASPRSTCAICHPAAAASSVRPRPATPGTEPKKASGASRSPAKKSAGAAISRAGPVKARRRPKKP